MAALRGCHLHTVTLFGQGCFFKIAVKKNVIPDLSSCKVQESTEGSKELNIEKFDNFHPSLDIASEL